MALASNHTNWQTPLTLPPKYAKVGVPGELCPVVASLTGKHMESKMQYFLDLETVAPVFFEKFGLIRIDEVTAELMAHNGATKRTYRLDGGKSGVEHAPFVTIEVENV